MVLNKVNLAIIILFFALIGCFVFPSISFADQAQVVVSPETLTAAVIKSGENSSRLKAFHIPLHGSAGQKEYILATIDKLEHKYNALVIMVNNKVEYDRYPEITSSEGEDMREVKPGWKPMPKQNLREIVSYAQQKGLEVIPAVEFLTHQSMFLRRSHPELMINEETYDPRNPTVYEIVYSVIDELIDVFKPRHFLIGHDEVREFWRKKADNQSRIPTYMDFAVDANRIAEYLKKKDVRTMMWGDMLLNPADANLSKDMRKTFHGGLQDYYKAVDLLNKDIIIVDWHYYVKDMSFPSVDYFLAKGFSVMGCTWKEGVTIENFSRYVCGKKDSKVLGMMATTWHDFNIKETAVIDQIITDSAKAFSACD